MLNVPRSIPTVRRQARLAFVFLVVVVVCGLARGQQSASYRVGSHNFNVAGKAHAPLVSPSFGISFASAGGHPSLVALESASFSVSGGFVASYPPPREVRGLKFASETQLFWLPEPSGGIYNLYRDLISAVNNGDYGSCLQQELSDEQTVDTDTPTAGDGFFYLVTAENLIGQEGIKGRSGFGFVRANPSPCP